MYSMAPLRIICTHLVVHFNKDGSDMFDCLERSSFQIISFCTHFFKTPYDVGYENMQAHIVKTIF